jgi:FkbH-like protein
MSAPAVPGGAAASADEALSALRTLRRDGLGTHVLEVRRLVEDLGAVDRERAGRLLAPASARAALREAGLPEVRLVVHGSSTLDALGPLSVASFVREGLVADVRIAGFNAWRTDVLAGVGLDDGEAPATVVLVLDDAVVFDEVADPIDVAAVADRCAALPARLADWVGRAKDLFGSLAVLTTIPLSPVRRDAVVDYGGKARLQAAWDRMNAGILELAGPGVVALSHEGLAGHAATTHERDRMRHIAGSRFAPEHLAALADELARIALAHLGRARKCLVLDLDDTLWGGIVGDDGADALRIGGAYPGSAHLELQRLARDLGRQGILLAVASKNHEEVALPVLRSHPEMALRADDVLAHRIDFGPKPAHLRSIAAELNIDVGALVFVDDNPVERGLMRHLEPTVRVVEVGEDPAEFASRLAAAGPFNRLATTAEDALRAETHRAERRRSALLESTETLEEYLTGLGSELTLERALPTHLVRTAQLFGKTNQFNLTGIRYTADELTALDEQRRSRIVVGRLTDTYGDSGLIVALVLDESDDAWSIGNMVLSCRAFSRSIEHATLAAVLAAAGAAGARAVRGRYVPTAKNRLFADVFGDNGFDRVGDPDERTGATTWERATAAPGPATPAWITINQQQEAFDVRP